ncbi:chitin recognition protein [Phlyctema vagabunda]|uniref:chitinase n=1 Tax=Phlyctema vagabunda TaxID=108571 RepID=A0ABR4P9H2_9HELO
MFSIQSLRTFGILYLLISIAEAAYNAAAKTNTVVYYGQGPSQASLSHFCQQSTIDIIVLGFVNVFPAQGNGYPGTNFGNQCWGGTYVYKGPGNDHSKDQLQSSCPQMVADIPVCQATYGKKIILSLGGGTNTYQLTSSANGVAFADFLWGAFGPRTAAWVSSGKPRPFDGSNGKSVEVDGFDFDIELPPTDSAAGYIAMINRLRSRFSASSKQYLITGAPQCIVPDANMGAMITKAKFDIIWVQFYNTAQCSASSWAKANPNYATTKKELASGFNYDAWTSYLAKGASANAKLYIGVSGSKTATQDPSYYLSPAQLSSLAQAYFCKPNFGGLMIWEATYADNNVNSGSTYYQSAKNALSGYGANLKCSSSIYYNYHNKQIEIKYNQIIN